MKPKRIVEIKKINSVRELNIVELFDLNNKSDLQKFFYSGGAYSHIFKLVHKEFGKMESDFIDDDFLKNANLEEVDMRYCIGYFNMIMKLRDLELHFTKILIDKLPFEPIVHELKNKYLEILEIFQKSFLNIVRNHENSFEVKQHLHSVINEIEYNESFGKLIDSGFNQTDLIIKDIFKSLVLNVKDLKVSETVDNSELLDYSNTKATEKIIYLNEIGVLDFLRNKTPFNTSINSLANLLSAITGENTTTLQPYLNAMYGRNIDTVKNPYNIEKTVLKVKNNLNNIGFQ